MDDTQTRSRDDDGWSRVSSQRGACLVVIHGPNLGSLFPLEKDLTEIGRASGSDILLPGASVSRRHCRIHRRGELYHIEDLGSTNGTWVNSKTVEHAELMDGDQVMVGDSILKFIGARSPEADYHTELHEKVARDSLTRLYNRRHFETLLKAEVLRAGQAPVSLVLLDLDHFKDVNDARGHLAGDAVLRHLAELLHRRARRNDQLFRIGGDEFALILPSTDLTTAAATAESYRELVAGTAFDARGEQVRLTASLGAAEWEPGMERPEDFIEVADRRLYTAKANGRNRVEPPPLPPGSEASTAGDPGR